MGLHCGLLKSSFYLPGRTEKGKGEGGGDSPGMFSCFPHTALRHCSERGVNWSVQCQSAGLAGGIMRSSRDTHTQEGMLIIMSCPLFSIGVHAALFWWR